ncbi:hypothetical protein [Alteromonas oceanisediminis]|uniref:hypothetical protein n=1 Tax=Alteromonas oceanisediminis TaxID=2836180 RepID=UPI001BDA1703|nr:hypothetical protein [Alteromonas oceanisediminis]
MSKSELTELVDKTKERILNIAKAVLDLDSKEHEKSVSDYRKYHNAQVSKHHSYSHVPPEYYSSEKVHQPVSVQSYEDFMFNKMFANEYRGARKSL